MPCRPPCSPSRARPDSGRARWGTARRARLHRHLTGEARRARSVREYPAHTSTAHRSHGRPDSPHALTPVLGEASPAQAHLAPLSPSQASPPPSVTLAPHVASFALPAAAPTSCYRSERPPHFLGRGESIMIICRPITCQRGWEGVKGVECGGAKEKAMEESIMVTWWPLPSPRWRLFTFGWASRMPTSSSSPAMRIMISLPTSACVTCERAEGRME